ncbi:LOW QUALITY PROTEIN: E3 ubiquitin-protein ligase rnf8-B-like [Discoglossus pictus]
MASSSRILRSAKSSSAQAGPKLLGLCLRRCGNTEETFLLPEGQESLNGVWLNKVRLAPYKAHVLSVGACIQLGVPLPNMEEAEFEYELIQNPHQRIIQLRNILIVAETKERRTKRSKASGSSNSSKAKVVEIQEKRNYRSRAKRNSSHQLPSGRNIVRRPGCLSASQHSPTTPSEGRLLLLRDVLTTGPPLDLLRLGYLCCPPGYCSLLLLLIVSCVPISSPYPPASRLTVPNYIPNSTRAICTGTSTPSMYILSLNQCCLQLPVISVSRSPRTSPQILGYLGACNSRQGELRSSAWFWNQSPGPAHHTLCFTLYGYRSPITTGSVAGGPTLNYGESGVVLCTMLMEELNRNKNNFEQIIEAKAKELQEAKEEKEKVQAHMDRLPMDELQCVICMEQFIEAVMLNCSHSFCSYCIKSWRKRNNECPICRQEIHSETHPSELDNFLNRTLSLDMRARREALIKQRKGF